jgi:hypothetical protein
MLKAIGIVESSKKALVQGVGPAGRRSHDSGQRWVSSKVVANSIEEVEVVVWMEAGLLKW